MKGLIMDYPLTLTQLFERSRKLFHRKTMATRVPGVGLQRYTYADYAERVCRLSAALAGLGIKKGVKVEELYREIRALRIYEGATEVQKIVIARELLTNRPAKSALAAE